MAYMPLSSKPANGFYQGCGSEGLRTNIDLVWSFGRRALYAFLDYTTLRRKVSRLHLKYSYYEVI